MLLLLTGVVACLLPSAMSQTASGSYSPQSQQSGGFYPSPMKGAPYPAPPMPAPAPEPQPGPTGTSLEPSGGGYPGPFFPPTGGALFGIAPVCAKAAIAITRLHSLIEPIKALMVGAFVFFVIKNYVLPYLIYYARAVEEEEGLERSLGKDAPLDRATLNILKAISKGVCLERIACHMGKKAKEYAVTKEVVRAIDTSDSERLLSIFRASATGDVTSCDAYRCDRKLANKNKLKITSS